MNSSAPSEPLVSVIIATYNRGAFLERCIRSVLSQTYRNVECLVVDGASKDHSVELLQRLAIEDSRLRFLSEPDDGEVYAINKGLDMARGAIVGFQASDDYYLPSAVENSVRFLVQNPSYVGASADALYVDEKGHEFGNGVITYRGKMARETIRRIIVRRYKMCPVCQGSFFGWRDRLLQHGKFDPAFSVMPDWEYYLRLLRAGEEIGAIPQVHFMYTRHADMGAVKYWEKVEKQRQLLYRIHGVTLIDRFLRQTVGRLMSYLSNPYRTPLLRGIRQEYDSWAAQRGNIAVATSKTSQPSR